VVLELGEVVFPELPVLESVGVRRDDNGPCASPRPPPSSVPEPQVVRPTVLSRVQVYPLHVWGEPDGSRAMLEGEYLEGVSSDWIWREMRASSVRVFFLGKYPPSTHRQQPYLILNSPAQTLTSCSLTHLFKRPVMLKACGALHARPGSSIMVCCGRKVIRGFAKWRRECQKLCIPTAPAVHHLSIDAMTTYRQKKKVWIARATTPQSACFLPPRPAFQSHHSHVGSLDKSLDGMASKRIEGA
jgi:hypothetical protein